AGGWARLERGAVGQPVVATRRGRIEDHALVLARARLVRLRRDERRGGRPGGGGGGGGRGRPPPPPPRGPAGGRAGGGDGGRGVGVAGGASWPLQSAHSRLSSERRAAVPAWRTTVPERRRKAPAEAPVTSRIPARTSAVPTIIAPASPITRASPPPRKAPS